MKDKVYILDTSALIGGFTPNLRKTTQYIVPRVLEEARSLPVKLKIETAVSSGQIKIREPSKEAVERVMEKVEKTKDRLSETDVQILALAEELRGSRKRPEIITDDYAIQNIAEVLKIPYSQVAQPGISDVYEWEMKCPACGRVYEEDIKKCRACGSKLRRKPKD